MAIRVPEQTVTMLSRLFRRSARLLPLAAAGSGVAVAAQLLTNTNCQPEIPAEAPPKPVQILASPAETKVPQGTSLNKRKIDSLDVKDKRVFIRVDFNVPQDKQDPSIITNTARIDGAVPSIQYCLDNGAKSVVLASHLGRPDGRAQGKYSLKPVAAALEKILGRPVVFLKDCVGPEAEAACDDPAPGTVFLLENLRFHPEEEGKGKDQAGNTVKPDTAAVSSFRASLRKLADVYVNDAFGTCHRAHSSMVGDGFDEKVAGFLVKKELEAFSKVLDNPQRPLVCIIGGSKVQDKILVVKSMVSKMTPGDKLVIGGGMTFSFQKVLRNMPIGNSIYDKNAPDSVTEIMRVAEEHGVEVVLANDFVTADKFGADAAVGYATVETGVPEGMMGLDCGPNSSAQVRTAILGGENCHMERTSRRV